MVEFDSSEMVGNLGHYWKGILVTAAAAGLLYAGWLQYSEFLTSGMRPTEGTVVLNKIEAEGAPELTAVDLEGRAVSLKQFSDKVVILNFWASWCDPCVQEFPSMVKLVDFFKGGVVLIAVSADKNRADVEDFLRPYKGKLPKDIYIVLDTEKKIPIQFGTEVLPESFIFGKSTKLLRKVAGSENWFAPGAVQLFNEIVNGK